jgi:hypothetical protein
MGTNDWHLLHCSTSASSQRSLQIVHKLPIVGCITRHLAILPVFLLCFAITLNILNKYLRWMFENTTPNIWQLYTECLKALQWILDNTTPNSENLTLNIWNTTLNIWKCHAEYFIRFSSLDFNTELWQWPQDFPVFTLNIQIFLDNSIKIWTNSNQIQIFFKYSH